MSKAYELLAPALSELDLDSDPEMTKTASRFGALLEEYSPHATLEPLSTFDVQGSGPVVVRDMPFHSLCAHHLVPFFGHATVAYLPGERVVGFGGIARAVQHFARRPQLQERMATQLVDCFMTAIDPRGVVVHLQARQLCMEMRGARSAGEVDVFQMGGDEVDGLMALVLRS